VLDAACSFESELKYSAEFQAWPACTDVLRKVARAEFGPWAAEGSAAIAV